MLMHMVFNTTKVVDKNAWGIDATPPQIMVDDGLHLGFQKRCAVLGVPGDVQIDFRIVFLAMIVS